MSVVDAPPLDRNHDLGVPFAIDREITGMTDDARHVAIVGGGPRGVSVIERLLINAGQDPSGPDSTVGTLGTHSTDSPALPPAVPLTIDLYDQVSPGSGRVWDRRQSPHLLMNTPSQEVTIFSGPRDDGPDRAGHGPSLAEWSTAPSFPGYDAYATRGEYGAYLQAALRTMIDNAPDHVRIRLITDHVVGLTRADGRFELSTESGLEAVYDTVVLATGHPRSGYPTSVRRLRSSLHQAIPGDSAADLPLDTIEPGEKVATIGMGLGFHDIVSVLTEARGGAFTAAPESSHPDGRLVYHPCGDEPLIIGTSRSGVPILARGRNEKSADHSFTPALCTVERMLALRSTTQLDFVDDLYPWIVAEVQTTYYRTILRENPYAAAQFVSAVTASAQRRRPLDAVSETAAAFGLDVPMPSLHAVARPFAGQVFGSPRAWSAALIALLRDDLTAAGQGNVSNPIKAALDTLRDLRPSIRVAVNNGGLTPASHERDFLGDFAAVYAMLAAGPPARRNQELLALIDAGIVRIAGPSAHLVDDGHQVRVVSPSVPGAEEIDTVVDARIPGFHVGKGRSALYRGMLATGLIRGYHHRDLAAGPAGTVETGACETDPETAEAIGADGHPVRGLFVLGIPTERQRWFTQIGNGRPGVTSEFLTDADRVARHCLSIVAATVRAAS